MTLVIANIAALIVADISATVIEVAQGDDDPTKLQAALQPWVDQTDVPFPELCEQVERCIEQKVPQGKAWIAKVNGFGGPTVTAMVRDCLITPWRIHWEQIHPI